VQFTSLVAQMQISDGQTLLVIDDGDVTAID